MSTTAEEPDLSIHLGADDLPFVEIGGGNQAQGDLRQAAGRPVDRGERLPAGFRRGRSAAPSGTQRRDCPGRTSGRAGARMLPKARRVHRIIPRNAPALAPAARLLRGGGSHAHRAGHPPLTRWPR
ncbi:hypothetical protein ACU686_16370 [Yinghuangia aomiensis]